MLRVWREDGKAKTILYRENITNRQLNFMHSVNAFLAHDGSGPTLSFPELHDIRYTEH